MHVETENLLRQCIGRSDKDQIQTFCLVVMDAIPVERRLPIIISAYEAVKARVIDDALQVLLDTAYTRAKEKGHYAEIPMNIYGLAFFCLSCQRDLDLQNLRSQATLLLGYIQMTGINEEQLVAKAMLVLG